MSQASKKPRDNLKHKELYDLLDMYKKITERSKNLGLMEQYEKALQLEETVRHRLRYVVRVFLLAESLDREHFASMLLEQNTIQPLFQFELGHVKERKKKKTKSKIQLETVVDRKLCSIKSDNRRGAFIEEGERILKEYECAFDKQTLEQPIRIVFTQAALPGGLYLWGHFEGDYQKPARKFWGKFKPNKFWIVSLASLGKYLPDIPAEQFILRVMQRACVLSVLPARRESLPNRLSHFGTYGCLFDYTVFLADVRYFVSHGFICEDCASNILDAEEIPFGHRSNFLRALQKWLVDTQLVSVASESG